jgi:hypothetical protein
MLASVGLGDYVETSQTSSFSLLSFFVFLSYVSTYNRFSSLVHTSVVLLQRWGMFRSLIFSPPPLTIQPLACPRTR